jgi:large repetitive protein
LPYQASGVTTGPDGELWLANAYVGEAVFVTTSLTVTPDSAIDSTPLTFSGSGFAPNETVQIYTRGIGSAVLTTATADGSGAINATATNPTWFYGQRSFYAMGQTSGKLAGAQLSIEAVLTLTPGSGPAGTSVTVNGSGFGPFEAVSIRWTNPRYSTGVATTDINGVFKGYEFVVPSNTGGGTHAVVGIGHKSRAQAGGRFTID